MNKLRKIMIVIEETDQKTMNDKGEIGAGFNMYMAGDKERIGKIPEDELGAAEFWGSKLFLICAAALQETGSIKTVEVKKNESNH